jgi:hypothetical protein
MDTMDKVDLSSPSVLSVPSTFPSLNVPLLTLTFLSCQAS